MGYRRESRSAFPTQKKIKTKAPYYPPHNREKLPISIPKEGGDKTFSKISSKPKPETRHGNRSTGRDPTPRPPSIGSKSQKTCQKGKNAGFFHSVCLDLADKFAGEDLPYTPPDLRRLRAAQFRDPLIKLFQSPQVIAAYADESERLARCSETLALWIDLVKFRDNPAVCDLGTIGSKSEPSY